MAAVYIKGTIRFMIKAKRKTTTLFSDGSLNAQLSLFETVRREKNTTHLLKCHQCIWLKRCRNSLQRFRNVIGQVTNTRANGSPALPWPIGSALFCLKRYWINPCQLSDVVPYNRNIILLVRNTLLYFHWFNGVLGICCSKIVTKHKILAGVICI